MDAHEMLRCIVRSERHTMVPHGQMDCSAESHALRARQLHWMIMMSLELDFCTETLLLAVNYFDRTLAHRLIPPRFARTLAQTCLYVAVKFNEPDAISIEDLASRWAPCSPAHVRKFELLVLDTLGWTLNAKTSSQVVGLLARELGCTVHSFQMRFMEKLVRLAALEASLSQVRPSVLGAALFLSGMNAFQMMHQDQLTEVEAILVGANIDVAAVRSTELDVSRLFCQGYSYPLTRCSSSAGAGPAGFTPSVDMSVTLPAANPRQPCRRHLNFTSENTQSRLN